MKMSCNGCRVLRKGCSEDCVIRPSLTWIKSPESQANATMFLAKFYGRAGLVNLLSAAPEQNRPAVFRSLLYEACGRIINPVYGSVGLLWSGNWSQCQSAVNAVLKGSATAQFLRHPSLDTQAGEPQPFPALRSYDIRHVPKTSSKDLHKMRTRPLFKHSLNQNVLHLDGLESKSSRWLYPAKFSDEAVANETWMSHFQENRVSPEGDSVFSVETVEATLVNRDQPAGGTQKLASRPEDDDPENQVKLELTLGSSTTPSRQGGCKPEIVRC